MSRLQNPFPYIREQKKKSNISLACPLCGRESTAEVSSTTVPFITVHCPNCVKYALQEEFFDAFDDAEHSYLVSGEMRHTQEDMTTHLISEEAASKIIEKQLKLASDERSMAYLVWHYDQKDGGYNGWREYIDLPAAAYCRDESDLKRITEKAVECGYLEEKDGRYKPTVAGVKFSEKERRSENALIVAISGYKGKKLMSKTKDEAKKLIDVGNDILRTEIHHPERGLLIPDYISGPKYDQWTADLQVFAEAYIPLHPCYGQFKTMAGKHDEMPDTCNKIIGILKSVVASEREDWVHEPAESRELQQVASNNRKVFIVHGRDNTRLDEIEMTVRRKGLEPVILKEEASRGMTLIEKIESHSDVAFAIILYTGCDLGKFKDDKNLTARARQNVVFEHGYMVAHLGRERVVALVEDGVETPGDLSGIVYISLNDSNWMNELIREMRAAGIEIQN